MDTALIVITCVSLALTGSLLLFAARLQREQREREEARVHALAREIADGEPLHLAGGLGVTGTGVSREEPAAPAVLAPGAAYAQPVLGSALADAFEPDARRFLIPLVGAAVASAALGGIYLTSARPTAAPAAQSSAATAPADLELVALRHERSGDTLTVSGVVRNPDGTRARRGLAAVVFVFDRSGAFLASGRSPIDAQRLEAGDESPFSVAVPKAHSVARYRVSFRTEQAVVPHVDRRKAGTEAPAPQR